MICEACRVGRCHGCTVTVRSRNPSPCECPDCDHKPRPARQGPPAVVPTLVIRKGEVLTPPPEDPPEGALFWKQVAEHLHERLNQSRAANQLNRTKRIRAEEKLASARRKLEELS